MDNMFEGGGATQGLSGYENPKMVQMPTMKQRLDSAVAQAEQRLSMAKRARALLDKNPDLEELLNILQRGNF